MDFATYLNVLVALVAVLALIGALAWLARRYGFGGAIALRPGARERRLAIVEVLPLDARRRLVLVRRDGVEHLILTGATADLVVETGIRPSVAPVSSGTSQPAGSQRP